MFDHQKTEAENRKQKQKQKQKSFCFCEAEACYLEIDDNFCFFYFQSGPKKQKKGVRTS